MFIKTFLKTELDKIRASLLLSHAGLLRFLVLFALVLLEGCATHRLNYAKQQKISDKVFVVTGASSGLGRGIAVQAGRYKAHVVIAARRTAVLEEVANEIRAAGGTALVVSIDVSKEEDMQKLMDRTLQRYGRIDVWVNNAGVAAIGRFWEVTMEEQVRVIDVNLTGVLYGSYLAVQQFRTQGYGTLINIGSVESEIPTPYQAAYAASKAGVRAIGHVLRQELRLNGIKKIRVLTVSPWALDTPLWGHVANYTGHAPRMVAMDRPQKAVNVVMHAVLGRKREIPVGLKAHLSYGAHRIFPAWTERLGANIAHKYQAEITPPAPPTPGNLFEPVATGTGVEGGFRQRMKQERKERKQR